MKPNLFALVFLNEAKAIDIWIKLDRLNYIILNGKICMNVNGVVNIFM